MKFFWFIFAFCILALITCGAREEEVITGPNLIPKAEEFVDLLENGDFAGVYNRFDKTMKNGMPEPRIKEVWQQVETKYGIFQKKVATRQVMEGGYDVVYVTCRFEKRKLNIKVVFNKQEQVSGLWFK
jgi:hypothetical protein